MGRAAVMLLIGAITARLLWTGGFGWFVQQRMRWPLIAAAAVLLVFGVYEAIMGAREERQNPDSVHRSVGPTVGWLLMLPMLVLVSVAPTALGASAATRVEAFTPTQTTEQFEAIPDTGGPVEMRVLEFLDRATWDPDRSLEGRTIRLEGLVVNDPDVPDGFLLTRFMVSCCAADGIPLQVALRETGVPLADDTWVVADVEWLPSAEFGDNEARVEATAVSIRPVLDGVPKDPYESPY